MKTLFSPLVLLSIAALLLAANAAALPRQVTPKWYWTPSSCTQKVLSAGKEYGLATSDGHGFHPAQALCVGMGGQTTCRWSSTRRSRVYSVFTVYARGSDGVVRSVRLETRDGHGIPIGPRGGLPDFYVSHSRLIGHPIAAAEFRRTVGLLARGAGATAVAGNSGGKGQLGGPAVPLAPLPNGNGASAFAFDPRRPSLVYVASRDARGGVYVFKTTDGGQQWRLTGAHGTGWQSDILSLTADPSRPGTLYAGTDTAVYKTVNGGRSWKPFNYGLFALQHRVCYWTFPQGRQCGKYPYPGTPGKPSWNHNNGWVLDVAVDPTNRSVVYSAAAGVRKSTDGGRTWKSTLKTKWKWTFVTRIAIAPTRPESIYAIAHNGSSGATRIYKSTNAGSTWQRTGGSDSSLPPSCCGDSMDALAIDPTRPQTVYAAVGNTVLTTTNGGASWQPMANGLPGKSVTSLAADPQRSGTVYASVEISHTSKTKAGDVERPTGGIYETTDGGQKWSEVWSGFGVEKVAVDPKRPSTIYAAGWAGRDPTHQNRFPLLRSTDGGRTWAIAG